MGYRTHAVWVILLCVLIIVNNCSKLTDILIGILEVLKRLVRTLDAVHMLCGFLWGCFVILRADNCKQL